MRNILFLWIIIRSRSILLTIHPIKLLSAFPLQTNFSLCYPDVNPVSQSMLRQFHMHRDLLVGPTVDGMHCL